MHRVQTRDHGHLRWPHVCTAQRPIVRTPARLRNRLSKLRRIIVHLPRAVTRPREEIQRLRETTELSLMILISRLKHLNESWSPNSQKTIPSKRP